MHSTQACIVVLGNSISDWQPDLEHVSYFGIKL